MSYFILQAGTAAIVPLGDFSQDNWFGVVNRSGAAGFFFYLQNGVAIGSITSSQPVVTQNGADANYVANSVAALLNSNIGRYDQFTTPLIFFNDQKDSPPGSYLDQAYYGGMEIWTNDNAIAHINPGKSFTQSTIQSTTYLPNQQSYTIAGDLTLNIPPM